MLCGPADESRKQAAAGVGLIHNGKVKVIKEKIRSKRLQQAWEAGCVEKYLIYLGWGRSLRQYVIYGKSGGSKEALATTEAIMEATEEEVNGIRLCQRSSMETSIRSPANWKLLK